MATIHLCHHLHGVKIASSDGEASGDRANGWVDFDPTVKPEPIEEPVVVVPSALPDFLKAPTKTKPKG